MLTCGKTSKDEAIKLPHQKKKKKLGSVASYRKILL